MHTLKRYYATDEELTEIHRVLKQTPCPYCRRIGMLIFNGRLFSYSNENTSTHRSLYRGQRVFCSNRDNRTGCGRSVSILRTDIIHGFGITAVMLWRFLTGFITHGSKKEAFDKLGISGCPDTPYRLCRYVRYNQSRICSLLLRHCAAPAPPQKRDPLCLVLLHVAAAFPDSVCPIHDFHHTFQIPFIRKYSDSRLEHRG